nr:hypothetical protein [Clostridia bacterium]
MKIIILSLKCRRGGGLFIHINDSYWYFLHVNAQILHFFCSFCRGILGIGLFKNGDPLYNDLHNKVRGKTRVC